MEAVKRFVAAIFDFLQGIVVFLAILVMIYLFLYSPQEINGASMEPTFYNAELIVTNKFLYKLTPPNRGDIVIFKSPKNKDVDYIKRVIGLPGERVKLQYNQLYINGRPIPEPYLKTNTPISGGAFLREGQEITVPQGYYFVCGDNRSHSSDSREFGPIPLSDFIGKGLFRYFPFNKFSVVEKPEYSL